jgi:hypothetical protein
LTDCTGCGPLKLEPITVIVCAVAEPTGVGV